MIMKHDHYPFIFPLLSASFIQMCSVVFEEETTVLVMSLPVPHWLSSFFCVLMDFLKWLTTYWPCWNPQTVSNMHTFVRVLCAFSFHRSWNSIPIPDSTVTLLPHCPFNAQQYFANEFHFYSNYLRATIGR